MTRQRLTILGATGSIGVSTLDVVARHPDRFEVVALTGHRRLDTLETQCRRHRPRYAVVGADADAKHLAKALAGLGTEVLAGPEALERVAALADVDAVMAAIVGAAGLPPTLAAVRAGKRVLLANKEALVMAGAVFMAEVKRHGATLLPIDSEHNAVFQSLPARLCRRSGGGGCQQDPADRIRRPVPYDAACASGQRHARRGVCPSQLGDGPQDLGRFRHHDEQGSGGHRGALAVQRRARTDRGGDSSAKRHPFAGAVCRWLGDGRTGQSGHAHTHRPCPGLSGAHRSGCCVAGPVRRSPS